MLNTLKRLVLEEEGQGMAEYALILVAIAIACIFAYTQLGGKINDVIDEAQNQMVVP